MEIKNSTDINIVSVVDKATEGQGHQVKVQLKQ